MGDNCQPIHVGCRHLERGNITHPRLDRCAGAVKGYVEPFGVIGEIREPRALEQLPVADVGCHFGAGLYLIRGCIQPEFMRKRT